MIRILSLLTAVILYNFSFSQLVITNQGAPAAAIVSGFIGSGLTITNPVINCPNVAYGTFSGGNALGVTNGITLTTGNVTAIPNSGSSFMSWDNNTTCSDPQLASLDVGAVNDCCILEFDVTPQCNQLTIKFIFGSEEYPEFAPPEGSVNDVFGFFVSGPNPAGGTYTNKNIAVINGSTICSINNINPSTNTSYYVDNSTGSGFVFDGYSIPIISTINVTPCQVYHFKLAISDVSDGLYDSGVLIDFLQCTNTFNVSTASTPASCGLNNGTASATVVGGIGTLSYTWAPAPGGGQGTATATGLSPGQSYTVTVGDIYSCIAPQSSTVSISNVAGPTVSVNSPTTCSGMPVSIIASPSVVGSYTYTWTVPSGVTNPGNVSSFNSSTAGVYSVVITDTVSGCSSPIASGTLTLNTTPTVSVNSPSTCSGTAININATPGSAATYSYSWVVPTGFTNPGNVATFNSSTAGTYSVVITNLITGCISTSASGTLTINPLSATVNNPSICSGSPATVIATPSTIGTYSYSWTVPLGVSSPGSVASFPTTTAGTYSVIITNTTTGCVSSSASGNAVVNTNPTVSVNSPSICAGQSTTVTATPGSAGTYGYAWTIPTGATAPGNIPTFSTTTAGTYSVIITNITTGCFSVSGSGIATVNPIPTVSVNSSTICSGTTATVTATPVGGGTYIYTWAVPALASLPGNVATFTTSTSGNYSVVITDQATLCSSMSASGAVNIIPLPTATISGTATICTGNSATITFNGTPNAVVSYTIDAGVPQTITLNAQGSGSVSTGNITQTSIYSLVGVALTTSPFCSQILNSTVTITVETPPIIAFTSNITSGCAPLTVSFTNNTPNSSNCNWNFGDGLTSNGCSIVTHTFNSAGCFDITLSASSPNSCFDNLKIPSMICVEALPVAAFNPTPDVVSSLNSSCTMSNISTGAVAYQWEFGDGTSSTDSIPVHNYVLEEGIENYTIKLTAYSLMGCSNSSLVTISVYEELVYFIPNAFTPDGDKFNQTFQPVFTKGYDPYSFNMVIVNRWGETVFETNDAKIGWDGTYGGKIVQDGTYTWKINFKVKSNDERKMETGHVVLIR